MSESGKRLFFGIPVSLNTVDALAGAALQEPRQRRSDPGSPAIRVYGQVPAHARAGAGLEHGVTDGVVLGIGGHHDPGIGLEGDLVKLGPDVVQAHVDGAKVVAVDIGLQAVEALCVGLRRAAHGQAKRRKRVGSGDHRRGRLGRRGQVTRRRPT